MTNVTKIVFLGATSASFGLSMLRDLMATPELSGSTLTLVGRDADSFGQTAALAALLSARTGAGLLIEHTTDRRAALDGAGFVVNTTAIDRNRLWKLDFEVPQKYGIRHTLGENGGPGGLFFTLRTLPLVLDIVRDMEAALPGGAFINFSNPESRIILALGKYSTVRCIGLCHGIFMAHATWSPRSWGCRPSRSMSRAPASTTSSGCMEIRDRADRRGPVPAAVREREESSTRTLARHPAAVPRLRPLADLQRRSLGEYLAYGWEGGEEGYDFEGDERGREDLARGVEAVLAGASRCRKVGSSRPASAAWR